MTAALSSLAVLATESGISHETVLAKVSVPIGILIFFGAPYLLLRSNLGTRRAYLVLATSTFGFMLILSLFWAFGAPGTPPATGPTNLPGQVADEYQPIWVPFAEDSTVAGQAPYSELVGNDAAFGEAPEDQAANVETGVSDIKNFFSAAEAETGYPVRIQPSWEIVDGSVGYAEAANGQPVVRATYGATYQLNQEGEPPAGVSEERIGTVIPEGEDGAASFTAYAFFDAGNPLFPSLVFIVVSLVLFALHALLLHRDEQGERRETGEVVVEERVPVSA